MFLQHEEVELIKIIRLSKYNQSDQYVWPYTSNLDYSVKSVHWTATHDFSEDDAIVPPEGSVILKAQIWNLEIIPKIQQFIWKVISRALPVYVQLCSRGINTDPTCQHFCMEDETINHVLFLCPHAQATWRCSGLPLFNLQSSNLEENISALFAFMNNVDTSKKISKFSFWVLWYIWKSRNEYLFSQRNVHPVEDIYRESSANDEWNSIYVSKKASPVLNLKPTTWDPPPMGWLKCNFDSTFRKVSSRAGIGWIIRDAKGVFVCVGMVRINNVSTAFQGEALALLYAMHQVWIRGWRQVWF